MGVVIAESPQLDPGVVIAVLLALLVSLLAGATAVGLLGTWLGRRLARAGAPAPDRTAVPRRRRVGLGLGGVGATLLSWSLLLLVPATVDLVGPVALLLVGLPLPVAWGWWTERSGRWGWVPPDRQDPAPPDASEPQR